MGSSISPLIAKLFMKEFEIKTLNTATNAPHLWLRFVDDTLDIHKAEHSTQLLHHINSQTPTYSLQWNDQAQRALLHF